MDPTVGFIYPFPASALSFDQLSRALSAWLTPPPPPVDDGHPNCPHNDGPCTSTTVPMVFSHDEWFVQCVPVLGQQIGQLLLTQELKTEEDNNHHQQQHRGTKDKDHDTDDGAEQWPMRRVLRHLLALTVRIPTRARPRAEMRLFIEVLGNLLRCLAHATDEGTKRLVQKALAVFLDRFEPIAQFLLLCRLFQFLVLRQLPLAHEAYEPQLMAWLVDIYRTKCYAEMAEEAADPKMPTTENGPGTVTPSEAAVPPTVGQMFRAQLGNFYAQLEDIVFEDLPASVNFYTSVCLLLVAHAMRRHRPSLLRRVGPAWLGRVREQLRDWRAMDEANKAAQQQRQNEAESRSKTREDDEEMNTELRRQMTQSVEQQQACRLNMLTFQLDEAEKRVEEALNGGRNE